MRSTRRGFSLIELLVVIAVIGVLIGLLLPAVQQAREAARRIQCRNNLKQIALAMLSYADTEGTLPLGSHSQQGWSTGSFFFAVLPQLEEKALYDAINFDVNKSYPHNATIHNARPGILVCPSDPTAAEMVEVNGAFAFVLCPFPVNLRFTSYAANSGTFYQFSRVPERLAQQNGLLFNRKTVALAEISDGTSNTFLLGERAHGRLEEPDRTDWHW